MQSLINRIKQNTILSVLTALFLGVIVLLISGELSRMTTHFLENYFELYSYTTHFFLKLYMIIFSLIIIWFVNNKTFSNYGFRIPKRINFIKMTFISVGIILASIIIGGTLIMYLFPPKDTSSMSILDNSLLQDILNIWIWSSVGEEFLTRGLVQGFTNHLKNKKVLGLSISVIFSGLFFGAMHITTGIATIVFFTTIGGFVMAYYREKTDSIIPAIYIHFLANATGFAVSYLISNFGLMTP